jgi:nucleoid-associated protein YgaU
VKDPARDHHTAGDPPIALHTPQGVPFKTYERPRTLRPIEARLLRQLNNQEEQPMPDQFEQLKQKYQPVLDKIQQEGAQLLNVNMDGNQLYVKAIAVSEASKNRIWDAIKAVDPTFADLKHDIEAKAGAQDYTVQPGDNLSKISKHFYGDANKYMTIAKANNLEDPDKIKVGQKLVIPAAA